MARCISLADTFNSVLHVNQSVTFEKSRGIGVMGLLIYPVMNLLKCMYYIGRLKS